jgi:multiple sugar transport system ATP-binding protein
MATVQLDGVCKTYGGGIMAVDRVDMAIADGEFMVLLGPSGCGKSTTLRMIAGLESISAGQLTINGRVMNAVPAKDRDIAMVFQSYALYPHMSVADNLAFGLRRRAVPSAEIARRVSDVALVLGLTPYLARKPAALSGGQRQRVALGRAMVREPQVFLFDEPLSNLDAALRVNTRNELIRQHHRLGSTMIYVTHDQVEAMTMGSRICVMNAGRVVQIGAPLEVYWNPADVFVARFLGAPPMNLLELPVRADGDLFFAADERAMVPLVHWPASTLAPYVGRTITVGVRAEDLSLQSPSAGHLAGRVDAIEPLGAETLVLVSSENVEITARLGRTVDVRVGELVKIYFDPAAVYLFEPTSGQAIRRADKLLRHPPSSSPPQRG